jgi:hypothetical protein
MSQFSAYEYRTRPGFDQNKFEGANQAIPMKTLVIHCFDPRAAEIPQKVAEHFGDEVHPGRKYPRRSWQSGWQHANVICGGKRRRPCRLRAAINGGDGLYIQRSKRCRGSPCMPGSRHTSSVGCERLPRTSAPTIAYYCVLDFLRAGQDSDRRQSCLPSYPGEIDQD